MEGEVVNVRRVAFERADGLAVSGGPELDGVIVAATGNGLAVGTDTDGPHPAVVGMNDPFGLRALDRPGPPNQVAVVIAGDEHKRLRLRCGERGGGEADGGLK